MISRLMCGFFSFIDLPNVLTKIKGDTSCQKIKQQLKDIKTEELDVNGNPIDPNREYIGNKVKVPDGIFKFIYL